MVYDSEWVSTIQKEKEKERERERRKERKRKNEERMGSYHS